ncbi:PRA1 family protein 3-like [Stegodyphus dumicola]|uniref:PRA1 family protein 3-like n=1 Tax=Stegodyphus dumicola TaxID=202533 RepID=UPI0015ABC9B3|nr:PRA1 family protein 3-like [Stegodyphus dumicola]
MSGEIEIARMRSLDDFLLESARFQIPNFKDLDKWSNRVCNNLLYYQTNYFFMAVVVFLIVGLIHPAKMLCGILAMLAAFGIFCYITNSKRSATKFKRDHPVISLFVIFTGGYFVVYMLGSVLVFLFGIMLPILLIFIHASMRLRNIHNKLTNKIETIGLKKTPMGLLLEALGQEHSNMKKDFLMPNMRMKHSTSNLVQQFFTDMSH